MNLTYMCEQDNMVEVKHYVLILDCGIFISLFPETGIEGVF